MVAPTGYPAPKAAYGTPLAKTGLPLLPLAEQERSNKGVCQLFKGGEHTMGSNAAGRRGELDTNMCLGHPKGTKCCNGGVEQEDRRLGPNGRYVSDTYCLMPDKSLGPSTTHGQGACSSEGYCCVKEKTTVSESRMNNPEAQNAADSEAKKPQPRPTE